MKIPQNQYKELITVCKETKTPYEIEKGILFNFIKIGKIYFACNPKDGQILYSFSKKEIRLENN